MDRVRSKRSALSRLFSVSPPTWVGILSRARVFLLPRHVSMTKKAFLSADRASSPVQPGSRFLQPEKGRLVYPLPPRDLEDLKNALPLLQLGLIGPCGGLHGSLRQEEQMKP